MHRTLLLALATFVAAPAFAGGDHVGRDDLHHGDEANDNTRNQPRDRTVEREDLREAGEQEDVRKTDLEADQEVRYENGRYIVVEEHDDGGKVEVVHQENAIRRAANEVKWDVKAVADDLNQSAKALVRDAGQALDEAEDEIDRRIDTGPRDRAEDPKDFAD